MLTSQKPVHFKKVLHYKPEYSQITENIWVGTNMCCSEHAQELFGLGFDADIDLEEIRDSEPVNVIAYLWLPTPDTYPPTQEQLATGVATLTELVRQNKKIYVHCRYGVGRSPTLVACYLVSIGLTCEQALDVLITKRPLVSLSEVQLLAVRKFAKSVSL